MKWIFFSYSLLAKSILLEPPQYGTFSLPLLLGVLWGTVARNSVFSAFRAASLQSAQVVHVWIREFPLPLISVPHFVPKFQSSRIGAHSFSFSWKGFLSFPSILLFLGSKPVQRARWKKTPCHFFHCPYFISPSCSASQLPLDSCWNLHHSWWLLNS